MPTPDVLNRFSTAGDENIRCVQFGVLKPSEIRGMSVCEVSHDKTWDKGEPRKNGVYDPRMGPCMRKFVCMTCGGDINSCRGHFGHVELAVPVFVPGFLVTVQRILRSVCFFCSKPLILPESADIGPRSRPLNLPMGPDRLAEFARAALTLRVCRTPDPDAPESPQHPGCGCTQPTFIKDKAVGRIIVQMEAGVSDPNRDIIEDVWMVRKCLQRITDEHVRFLGLDPLMTRPEWLMPIVWPVPPPCVRPMHTTPAHNRGDDDLTIKLKSVVQTNRQLRECTRPDATKPMGVKARELWVVMQWHVNTLVDNNRGSEYTVATHRKNNKPLKTIRERIKGKDGRVRENIQGKRVDGAGRTVLVPGIDIDFREVGIPEVMAMVLCITETVTVLNRDVMEALVRTGAEVWPGANYVIVIDPKTRRVVREIDLAHHDRRHEISLQLGWKVKRHLNNGDPVIVNRQPSLHRQSMMCHVVRVTPGHTLRIKPHVMKPYNADCDGDELTFHLPQSEDQMAEMMGIMNVARHVRSAGNHAPCMGTVQGEQTGLVLMTQRGCILRRREAMGILWSSGISFVPEPVAWRADGEPVWTGRQLFSCCLPEGLRMRRGGGDFGEHPGAKLEGEGRLLIIENGQLLFGVADKRVVGATHDSAIDLIALDHGPDAVVTFFNRCTSMARAFNALYGFSVHLSDVIIPKGDPHRDMVVDIMTKAKDATEKMAENDESEEFINDVLNRAIMYAGGVARRAFPDVSNNFVAMIDGGGKGKPVNITQLVAGVGQQNVDGGRPRVEPTSDRCVPYFESGDRSMSAMGFVRSSYSMGLNPIEFFFHCMGGREGLVDTAVRTSETGYISRRLVKFGESQRVHHGDASVRDAWGLVEFRYGDDGIDPARLCFVSPVGLSGSLEDFEDRHLCREFANEEAEEVIVLREIAIEAMGVQVSLHNGRLSAGLDPNRIVTDTLQMARKDGMVSGINIYSDVIVGVREASLAVKDMLSTLRPTPTYVTMYLLRMALLGRRLSKDELRVTHHELHLIFKALQRSWMNAQVDAGEMVGVIAATSVSEPSMQLTLNTFHFSGLREGRKMTLGLPRYKEIISLAKNPATPLATVYLLDPWRRSRAGAEVVRRTMQLMFLSSIVVERRVDVTDFGRQKRQELARDSFLLFPDYDHPDPEEWSSHACVLVLDGSKMRLHGLELDEVCAVVRSALAQSGAAVVIPVGHTSVAPELHVWPVRSATNPLFDHPMFATMLGARLVEEVILRGIIGVTGATVRHVTTTTGTVETGLVDIDEYIIETDGYRMDELLAIEGVDVRRTTCNNAKDMMTVFGIESAWRVLTKEMREIFDATSVDFRHISLISRTMCRTGNLSAISRFGIREWNNAPMFCSAFEQSVNVIEEAAMFGTIDMLRGVAERVNVGAIASCGTGTVRLHIDSSMGLPQEDLANAVAVKERAEAASVVATAKAERERRLAWQNRRRTPSGHPPPPLSLQTRNQPFDIKTSGLFGNGVYDGAGGGAGGGGGEVVASSAPMQDFFPQSPRWIRKHNSLMPPPSPEWKRQFVPPSPRWVCTNNMNLCTHDERVQEKRGGKRSLLFDDEDDE